MKATADHIHEHGGEFVLPVKENRRALFDALDALPWGQVPVAHTATDKGHGRITTRTIQTLPAPPDLPFPHVDQVWLIERYVTDLAGIPTSAVAALGVTNLHAHRAAPADIARLVRDHFVIAHGEHRLADVLRYVNGIKRRLDKLPENPARDLQKMAESKRRVAHFSYVEEVDVTEIEALCEEIGEQPAHVALAWLLHQDGVTGPIIGPRTEDQLDDAQHAITVHLGEDVLKRLDDIFPGYQPAPEHYAW